MPSLSYKGRFFEYVEAGLQKKPKRGARIKRQTIRALRKIPFKAGDTLYHFYGLRTKFSRRLGTSICKAAPSITVMRDRVLITMSPGDTRVIISPKKLDKFAYQDGFANWDEMVRWWKLTHGPKCLPFTGQIMFW